jgi:ketosteroid isomerase-like protein
VNAAEGIHEGNERFKRAVREADSTTPPSLYTRDGKILPPNGEAVSGSDSIAEFWQAFFEESRTSSASCSTTSRASFPRSTASPPGSKTRSASTPSARSS